MKRERRHELQHNDLAEWIINAYERIAPYRNIILGVSLLVLVLVIAVSVWHNHSVAQAGEAWNSLGIPVFQPRFPDEQTIGMMQHAAQANAGTPAAQWADVFAGDTALMIGANRVLTEKKVGVEYLGQARDFYAKALDSVTIPAAREQAMFGQARAIESLIQNKAQLDEAIAAYQKLNTSFPHGMYKVLADQRIEHLQKKETLKFYESLAQYTPAPPKPKAESPRSQLGSLESLPENPPDEPLVPQAPVRGAGGSPGPVPEPTLTPTEPAKPKSSQTEAPKPDTAKPQAAKPDVSKSDTAKPEATKKAK